MEFHLTPLVAVILLIVAVASGHLYRENWKSKPKRWLLRAWIYGAIACVTLLALGFIPLEY